VGAPGQLPDAQASQTCPEAYTRWHCIPFSHHHSMAAQLLLLKYALHWKQERSSRSRSTSRYWP